MDEPRATPRKTSEFCSLAKFSMTTIRAVVMRARSMKQTSLIRGGTMNAPLLATKKTTILRATTAISKISLSKTQARSESDLEPSLCENTDSQLEPSRLRKTAARCSWTGHTPPNRCTTLTITTAAKIPDGSAYGDCHWTKEESSSLGCKASPHVKWLSKNTN